MFDSVTALKLIGLLINFLLFSFKHWFHVRFQVTFFWEGSLLWFCSFMQWFHMWFQVTFLWETVITKRALVRLLSFMNWLHMLFHVTPLWETVIANGALVQLLFFMHWFHVVFQDTFICETVIANQTFSLLYINAFNFFSSSSFTLAVHTVFLDSCLFQ